jgi:hypothetical protein
MSGGGSDGQVSGKKKNSPSHIDIFMQVEI